MSNAPQPASTSTAGSASPQKPPASKVTVAAKPAEDPRAKLRRSVYGLLITVSIGVMIGRILAVNSVDQVGFDKQLISQAVAAKQQELKAAGQWHNQTDKELEELTKSVWQPLLKERPFLSANDRSRWLTMRALVEKGSYAVEDYVADSNTNPNWDSIDTVMHTDAAGAPRIYSSKPPLLATLYAGPYWAAGKIGSALAGKPVTLGTNPYEVGRSIVVLVNVIPLAIYFFVLAAMVERYGRTDWGRMFVMAAATFGTFLTTFAVSLNNHLPAAACAAIAVSAALSICYGEDRRWRTFALCGFFAALTAACELPALSLFALISAGLLWKAPKQTLIAYLPPAAVIVAAFFATNWLAHGSLIPPYAHRVNTEPATMAATATTAPIPSATTDGFEGKKTLPSGQSISMRGNSTNWYDYEFTRTDGKLVESYWRNPKGIDSGEASIGKYALHLLVGHHGIFSLTPIWLLALPGLLLLWFGKDYRLPALAVSIGLISVVCITFYILRPVSERNYGGMTSGFRWVFWLAPLWLLAVLPTADKLAGYRLGRLFGYLLLGLSVLAASYPVWNPWTSPYLHAFWTYMGW